MHHNTKVATCSYCGTRAALVLGRDRHELICSRCGAPLRDLKSLPVDRPPKATADTRKAQAATFYHSAKKPKRKKKGKPRFKRLLGEILDELDDIFD